MPPPRIATTISTPSASCGRSPTAAQSAGATLKKAYLFFNNHFSAQGVANAVQLRRQLGQPVPEPLPPDLARAFPWLEPPAYLIAIRTMRSSTWIFSTTSMPLVTLPNTV